MNALVFDGPRRMSVQQRPDPSLVSDDVLIEVIATGICGSDLHGYTGETGRRHRGQVMGHETVGRVHSRGERADGPEPGSVVTFNPILSCGVCASCKAGTTNTCEEHRVIGVDPALDGSFADFIVVPSSNVVELSSAMPILHGALVEPLAVGYHALQRGEVTAEDRVLIVGGGPIGQACALAARRMGVESVLVSEILDERRALLTKLGFESVTPRLLEARLPEVLDGPATKVIDAVGIDASLADALSFSTRGAVIVLVGMGARQLSLAAFPISVGERTLVGSYCYTEEHFRSTAQWVSSGQRDLDALIDVSMALIEGPAAFRSLVDGSIRANKIGLRSGTGS